MHILVSVVIIVSVMAYFFYASYSIRACIYMCVFCCKKTEEKIIAITFDDGPDPIPVSYTHLWPDSWKGKARLRRGNFLSGGRLH